MVVLERVDPLVSDTDSLPGLRCLTSPWDLNAKSEDISSEDLKQLPVNVIFDPTVSRRSIRTLSPDSSIIISLDRINGWYGKYLLRGAYQ